MKKIVVIALACILALSSFLYTSCDEREDNNTEQTTEIKKEPQNNSEETITSNEPLVTEAIEVGPGDKNPEDYSWYITTLDRIENSQNYVMKVEKNGLPYISYSIDGKGGEQLSRFESSYVSLYNITIVDGQAYANINYQPYTKTELTQEMLGYFDEAKTFINKIIKDRIDGSDMKKLSIYDDPNLFGQKKILFDIDKDGVDYSYSFVFGYEYVEVVITTTQNSQKETLSYRFDFIPYADHKILAPI